MFRYYPGFHHGPGPIAWVFLALLVALLVLGLVALVRYWSAPRQHFLARPTGPAHHLGPMADPALTELRIRYARGELTPEEYARRAADLGYPVPGGPPTPPSGAPPAQAPASEAPPPQPPPAAPA